MATLGNNITYMSPSRGFSVSLGTSLTVLTCSKLGLPVSTTHCITGATTAVGLCSGGGRKVEYDYSSSCCRPARTYLTNDSSLPFVVSSRSTGGFSLRLEAVGSVNMITALFSLNFHAAKVCPT